jgi:hypothetical protein
VLSQNKKIPAQFQAPASFRKGLVDGYSVGRLRGESGSDRINQQASARGHAGAAVDVGICCRVMESHGGCQRRLKGSRCWSSGSADTTRLARTFTSIIAHKQAALDDLKDTKDWRYQEHHSDVSFWTTPSGET